MVAWMCGKMFIPGGTLYLDSDYYSLKRRGNVFLWKFLIVYDRSQNMVIELKEANKLLISRTVCRFCIT